MAAAGTGAVELPVQAPAIQAHLESGHHQVSPLGDSKEGAPRPESAAAAQAGDSSAWARLKHLLAATKRFVIANFLVVGFAVGLLWALTWPMPGEKVASVKVGDFRLIEYLNNCMVFLVSGLTLRMSHFKKLGAHWCSVVYGIVAILLITPILALVAQRLPLEPLEFRLGLALFSIVPTTLGVGVALTQLAHGNQAMSLLLTVVTNMLGVVTVPYLLHGLVGTNRAAHIDPSKLVVKLLFTVLVPTVVGAVARASSSHVRRFVAAHRTALSIFSSTNLIMIIWQTLSGARDLILRQRGIDLFSVAVAAIGLHLVCLAFNAVVAQHILRCEAQEAVCIIIMSSQKSAPVAVTVISYITKDLATGGLLVIPCVMGQLAQIFLGSAIAHRLALWVDAEEAEKKKKAIKEAGGEEDERKARETKESADEEEVRVAQKKVVIKEEAEEEGERKAARETQDIGDEELGVAPQMTSRRVPLGATWW